MTARATVALWVGVVVVTLLGLYPPWVGGGSHPIGHALLISPPTPTAQVELTRLVPWWVIVAAVTTGLVVTLNRKPTDSGTAAVSAPAARGSDE